MFVLAGVVVAAALLVALICALAPFLVIAGAVWLIVRCVSGPRPPAAAVPVAVVSSTDPARDLGWAVGLLVTGALWLTGSGRLAAMLVGLGAGLLARRLVEMRRRVA